MPRERDVIVPCALCKVGVRKCFQNQTNIVFNVTVFGVPFLFKLKSFRFDLLVLLQDMRRQRYETKVPSEVFLRNPTVWSLERLCQLHNSAFVFFGRSVYAVEKY